MGRESRRRFEARGPAVQLATMALLAGLSLALTLGACAQGDAGDDLERRAQRLNQTIMCPVCPGESIDQSQNPLAIKMRGIVADRLSQGWSEKQISDHFVASYGDSVLLSPPTRGFSLLIWVLPPAGIAVAMAGAAIAIRQMGRGREPGEVLAGTELSDEELDRYSRRLDRVLSEADRRPSSLRTGGDG